MSNKQLLQVFEHYKVRTIWDEETQKWYFSIVDVCGVLTDSPNPRKYWSVLKSRLKREGNETATNCSRLKIMAEDGKMRMTDVADTEQLFRLIQSIPSPKAEPFKQWMAHVATIRIDQMMNPELSIEQAREDYRKKGYSDRWINQRLKGIEARNELTDEWKERGVKDKDYGLLTDDITKTWSGKTTGQYKRFKKLDPKKKESLRDNMTTIELALNTLAEASTAAISRKEKPTTLDGNRKVARKGGNVAKIARTNLEEQLGQSVVTSQKASDYLPQQKKMRELESKENDDEQA
ncbi:MAG: Bro-N domain-containing protein [Bacteroidales bacterium]|jgi:prophage antirepressor-like protein|nr:Bro-N domain-containing protein [Bacteroidales bacterium]